MTGPDPRLQALREQAAQAKRDAAWFFYPETARWSDGVTRRFKVTDPNSSGADTPLKLATDALRAGLRIVKFHPDTPLPEPGALPLRVTCSEGPLVLGALTDLSNLSQSRRGVARLVDERVYPLYAVSAQGYFRLRIMALDAAAVTTGSNDLQVISNNSHRGHLPPGVRLDVGEVLTTSEGDQYEVVPPVQRDALGDTVGLSWQRDGAAYTPPPAPSPKPQPGEPAPAPTPDINPDDRWWKEGL